MAADAVTGEMAPPQGGEPFHETSEIVGGCSGGAGATENDFVMPDIVPVQNNPPPVPGRADRSSEPQLHQHSAEAAQKQSAAEAAARAHNRNISEHVVALQQLREALWWCGGDPRISDILLCTLDTFVVSLCAGQEKSRILPKPTSEKNTIMLDFFPN